MSKADTKHIDRRAIMRGAALATAAATIPATIATAIGAAAPAEAAGADPIFAMIAEHHRIKALAEAATERARAIRDAWNGDLSGCGWPMADFSKREIAEMKNWLEKRWRGHFDGRVDRHDVLAFNAELEVWNAKRPQRVSDSSVAHLKPDISALRSRSATDHPLDGEFNMDIGGVLGAVADLERLGAMPGKAVAS